MDKKFFGETSRGKKVTLYTLTNKNGMQVSVMELGCTVVSIKVPDAQGNLRDVLLGYDKAESYWSQDGCLGATIGRNANRIAGAACEIDGVIYQLEVNDNENNIHSGVDGFHNVMFTFKEADEHNIVMEYDSKDGNQGYPGNMHFEVTFTLTDDNEFKITYDATTDKTTIANVTNHGYYNLDGHDAGVVEDTLLMIAADRFTPSSNKAIPTGEIIDVAGTPMDFRTMKPIGQDIAADYQQIRNASGYDHNFVINGYVEGEKEVRLCAKAVSKKSGIVMEVFTDLPGVQFYTGNFIGRKVGKDGVQYDNRHGFCLETQYFPNAINEPNFESPLISPEKPLHTETIMKFSVEK